MCSDGKSTMQDFDVIISSEVHGLTIGRRGIYPAWSFSSDHHIELHESAGWVVVDTNDPPRFAFMSKEWFSPLKTRVVFKGENTLENHSFAMFSSFTLENNSFAMFSLTL